MAQQGIGPGTAPDAQADLVVFERQLYAEHGDVAENDVPCQRDQQKGQQLPVGQHPLSEPAHAGKPGGGSNSHAIIPSLKRNKKGEGSPSPFVCLAVRMDERGLLVAVQTFLIDAYPFLKAHAFQGLAVGIPFVKAHFSADHLGRAGICIRIDIIGQDHQPVIGIRINNQCMVDATTTEVVEIQYQ